MRLRRLMVGTAVLAMTAATFAITPGTASAASGTFYGTLSGTLQAPPEIDEPTRAETEKALRAFEDKVRVIIDTKAASQVDDVAEDLKTDGDRVVLEEAAESFLVAIVDKADVAQLKKEPEVESVKVDTLTFPTLLTSTKVIGADKVHAAGVTGSGLTVAVIDTGVDRNHPFLKDRIVAEACFSTADIRDIAFSLCPNHRAEQVGAGSADAETANCYSLLQPGNLCSHGTHVAGIAAGKLTSGAPADGVAPGASIIAIQAFSKIYDPASCGGWDNIPCVGAYQSNIRQAVAHVETLTSAHKIAAANLSLGGGSSATDCDRLPNGQETFPEAASLRAKGVATVVSSGNEHTVGAVSWPACVSSVVTVGATDDNDAVAPFSNQGKQLELFAPGVGVTSSVPSGDWWKRKSNNTYASYSGTSMAAPHVAGAFALLRQKKPTASVDELLTLLRNTGKPITYDSFATIDGERIATKVTTPRIDLWAALNPAPTTPTPTPTTTPSTTPSVTPTVTPTATPTVTPTTKPTPTATPTTKPTATAKPTSTPTPTATPKPTPTPTATGKSPSNVNPIPVPDLCGRGKGKTALTAAQWAAEFHKKPGKFTDKTLICYLSLSQNGSKVFPEATDSNSLAKAYKVLKGKSARAALDRELLAAWLNWAHGVYNGSAKVHGTTTLKSAVAVAEKHRLDTKATAAQISGAAKYLSAYVNKAK
ncbi:S8 family peptidase [Streptosporangium canum]|uniref:S8 family peptidase n=1 Tax=Streptosporangium canum TaxID=324952 RepID=UPI00367B2173